MIRAKIRASLYQSLRSLSFVTLLTALVTMGINSPTIAAPKKADASENPEVAKILEDISRFNDLLTNRVPNSYGAHIPTLDSPDQVVKVIRGLEKILQSYQKQNFNRPETIRSVVLQALVMLYQGRGNTSPKDGTGWNIANRRNTQEVTSAISEILETGLLDAKGLQLYQEFIESFDFNSSESKRQAGFPDSFEIGTEVIKADVLKRIAATPPGQPLQPIPQSAERFLTTTELIQKKVENPKLAERLIGFVQGMDEVPYDDAVQIAKDPNREFPEYYGRKDEIRNLVDLLTKTKKHHVLLTGKAGVGKTTIVSMLQDLFVQQKISIRGEEPPIVLEVPITMITNPSDPSEARALVNGAKVLSEKLDRRVILFIDEAHVATTMTRNALKAFLTRIAVPESQAPRVHIVFATTSSESRTFLSDAAFSRRFSYLDVPEFSENEVVELVKKTDVPRWRRHFKSKGYAFDGISEDAIRYAYRHRHVEQRHSETGTTEIIEAAIAKKMNDGVEASRTDRPKQGNFEISEQDIRGYIKDHHGLPLLPGDEKFNETFEKMWTEFSKEYPGNEGLRAELKPILRSHFLNPNKTNMTAIRIFGPPGAGKTFLGEMIAKHFLGGAYAPLKASDYQVGGSGTDSKWKGSPAGHVNADQQVSPVTKAIKEHPKGFVLTMEEADKLHPDIQADLTDIITSKTFVDGLNQRFPMDRVIYIETTNIGQEEMIPPDAHNKMTWPQYEIRKSALTETRVIDGNSVEVPKKEKLDAMMDRYVEAVMTRADPDGDTSLISQEAQKQRRRFKPLYAIPPNQDELVKVSELLTRKFIENSQADYGVTFKIDRESVLRAADIEHFEFEKGYSYVKDLLQEKIFDPLGAYYHQRGSTVQVSVVNSTTEINGRSVPAQELHVSQDNGPTQVIKLGSVDHRFKNPWGSSPEMMKRIREFPKEMTKHIKGNEHITEGIHTMLKNKAANWNANMVVTLVGTSGNGKTETAKALARTIYGTESALFKITGVDHPWDLSDYFRPPTGIVGSNKETDFERWFKSRKSAGGGVILFDELLSDVDKKGNTNAEGRKGGKIAVLSELYELLDERKLKLGGKIQDASAFTVVITGNFLQELFQGLDDNPETEQLVSKILEELKPDLVDKKFEEAGIDPPKRARLGRVFVLGPQPRQVSLDVGHMKLDKSIRDIQALQDHPIEIKIDPKSVQAVVERLTTVRLGMRAVDRGFETLIFEPLRTMIVDLRHHDPKDVIQSIEMKLNGDQVQWLVNGKEVGLEATSIEKTKAFDRVWNYKSKFSKTSSDQTPNLKHLITAEKMKFSPELLKTVAIHEIYGHWMVDALLNHSNNADFVSLIPGENYLGYVRPQIPDEAKDITLSSLFKELVMLEAGHRAVFAFRKFASGGGNAGENRSERNGPPRDDLGKELMIIEKIINNALIPGVNESSSPRVKAAFREYIQRVLDVVTDEIIHDGLESKKFEPAFKHVLEYRYAKREQLEQFIKEIDFNKAFGEKEVYLSQRLAEAILHIEQPDVETKRSPAGKKAARMTRKMGLNLLGRILAESDGEGSSGRGRARIEKIREHIKKAFDLNDAAFGRMMCVRESVRRLSLD